MKRYALSSGCLLYYECQQLVDQLPSLLAAAFAGHVRIEHLSIPEPQHNALICFAVLDRLQRRLTHHKQMNCVFSWSSAL